MTKLAFEQKQVLSIYWTVFKNKTLDICALVGGFAAIATTFAFFMMSLTVVSSFFIALPSPLLAQCISIGPNWALLTLGAMAYHLIMCRQQYGVARILATTAAALLTQFLMLEYLAHLASIA